ncbi:MAG: hypothetical protein J5J06_00140 [Phycisphaerae bacterium]|nr:hypothetical protein [Phycisphaerae bacterium]
MNSHNVQRIKSSVEDLVDGEFKAAPLEILAAPLVLNAHELLDYARMIAEIANYVRGRMQSTNAGLVGFPTGSVALGLECSIAIDIGPKVRFIRDLKHSPKGESKKDREPQLFNLLDELRAVGVDEYLILDEVVSGSSFAGTVDSVATWAGRNDLKNLHVTLLGASQLGTDECERVLKKRTRRRKADLQLKIRAFTCNTLLAFDELGEATAGIARHKDSTGYGWSRISGLLNSGESALRIECPNGGPTVPWPSSSDLASSFASVIKHILDGGSKEFSNAWPETIKKDTGCSECKALLDAARRTRCGGDGGTANGQ